MQFMVYSRTAIEAAQLPDTPHIVVSISTPESPPAKIRTNGSTLDVLRLWFHDMDSVKEGWEEKEEDLFQRDQAEKVVDLVLAHPEAEWFIVHCDAGISRSSATAAAIMKGLTGDDSKIFKNPRYYPNRRVYRAILEAWYDRKGE